MEEATNVERPAPTNGAHTTMIASYQKACVILSLPFCGFFGAFGAWLNIWGPLGCFLVVLVSIALRRAGRIESAAWLLAAIMWLAPAWNTVITGGLYSPILIWLIPPIFMAAALVGWRASIGVGAASLTLLLGMIPFRQELFELREIPDGPLLDSLLVMSGASAMMLITFYGVHFTRAATKTQSQLQAMQHVLQIDLAARKEAEARAMEAKDVAESAARVKAQFLASMSHEIRTPMNGVHGMAHLLSRTDLNEEQSQYLGALTTSATALLTLIDDILDYSKLEEGRFELSPTPFSLRKMVGGVDELLSLKAEQKAISFATIVEHSVPDQVVADEGRLRQILINLANNAVKFTQRGNVLLRVYQDHTDTAAGTDYALGFEIVDTGIGMSPATLEQIFKPFTQADASTVRKFGGTGLGLSISKRLCELMKSRLEVQSTQDVGSRFAFTARVPVANAQSTQPIVSGDVLVVSEAGNRRDALRETLRHLGYSVRVADDLAAFKIAHLQLRATQVVVRAPTSAAAKTLIRGLRRSSKDLRVAALMVPVHELHAANKIEDGVTNTVLSEPYSIRSLLDALEGSTKRQPSPLTATNNDVAMSGTVLVVDDNRINVMLAEAMLRRLGLDVITRTDGAQAVEAAQTESVSLILMDCQMPVMDGCEATRRIRALGSSVPIVAVTAGVMRIEREACFEAGMNDYVAKPICPDRLKAVLAQYLNSKPSYKP